MSTSTSKLPASSLDTVLVDVDDAELKSLFEAIPPSEEKPAAAQKEKPTQAPSRSVVRASAPVSAPMPVTKTSPPVFKSPLKRASTISVTPSTPKQSESTPKPMEKKSKPSSSSNQETKTEEPERRSYSLFSGNTFVLFLFHED
jgi:hypothetical protein